jgi:hypothetical protein
MLTAYLAAVDHRIKAAAIACYFSTLEEELETGSCNYDSEQILWRQAKLGIDKPDFLIARAPQPTLVLLTSHDCFPLAGGRAGFEQASASFASHFGRMPSEIGLYGSEAIGHHGVTTTGFDGVHTFFKDNLMPGTYAAMPIDVKPASEFTPIPLGDLLVMKDMQVELSPSGARPSHVADLIRNFARPLLKQLRARRSHAARSNGGWLNTLPEHSAEVAGLNTGDAEKHFLGLLSNPPDLKLLKARFFKGGLEEWFILPTKGACALTLRVFRRIDDDTKLANVEAVKVNDSLGIGPLGGLVAREQGAPAVLWLGGGVTLNRDFEEREVALLNGLADYGVDIVLAGLCGLGDALWKGGLWDFAPLLLGKTHVALHAEETLRIIAWAIGALKATSIVLVAVEDASAAVLHAALQAPAMFRKANRSAGIVGIALVRSISSFAGVVSRSATRCHGTCRCMMFCNGMTCQICWLLLHIMQRLLHLSPSHRML